jgi:hypothetical protein
MRLVQLSHPTHGRKVATVEEPLLHLLNTYTSVYDLALHAIEARQTLAESAQADAGTETLDYDPVYTGHPEWSLLPPLDHPTEPARCLVSGTGLTHTASARNRDAMHAKSETAAAPLSDSMKMFNWGVEGGKPAAGEIGVQPEWFYKGNGQILRGHMQPLEVPTFGNDGGEEPEVAGLYIIAPNGTPYRVGFAIGNEFADHIMERKNYLYLAPSKLRHGAIGPEVSVGVELKDVKGAVKVERHGEVVWSAAIATGDDNMSHTLANLEHHQFKYPEHRRPGDVHIHYFGADAFSFGAGVALEDGDMMVVEWEGLGRALRNPIRIDRSTDPLVTIAAL